MEKPQLINFIAKVMEDSGFKVYKNFKTSQRVIDIYAILPTTIGDFGVVVACENYEVGHEVGVDILKKMETAAESLNASKVAIVTSSNFTSQATNYARKKNIKLVDREDLVEIANKYQENTNNTDEEVEEEYYTYEQDDIDYLMRKQDEKDLIYNSNTLYSHDMLSGGILSKSSRGSQRPSLAPSKSNYSNLGQELNFDFGFLSVILANPIAVVILVVIVSYLLSYLFANVLKAGAGMSGLIEMFVALAMSYALTYFFSERSRYFIVRGTVIFFVSLIVLIILIFI